MFLDQEIRFPRRRHPSFFQTGTFFACLFSTKATINYSRSSIHTLLLFLLCRRRQNNNRDTNATSETRRQGRGFLLPFRPPLFFSHAPVSLVVIFLLLLCSSGGESMSSSHSFSSSCERPSLISCCFFPSSSSHFRFASVRSIGGRDRSGNRSVRRAATS